MKHQHRLAACRARSGEPCAPVNCRCLRTCRWQTDREDVAGGGKKFNVSFFAALYSSSGKMLKKAGLGCEIWESRSHCTSGFEIVPGYDQELIRCKVQWQSLQSVIRLCSESSPDWLRNCLWWIWSLC